MLKNCNEEDFYELKSVSEDRLDPSAIGAFFILVFIIGVVMYMVSALGVSKTINVNNKFWINVVRVDMIILIVQLIIIIFFRSLKKCYGHQKIQAILLCILSIVFPVEMYQVFFIMCENRLMSDYVINFGGLILLGGLVFTVISTLRGINRVKNGHFRKDGKYLYDFKNSKIYISSPVIYGIILMAGLLSRNLSGADNSTSNSMVIYFFLIIVAIIQYAIAIAWPEFFLLAYCKFRFETFNEKIPKAWLKEDIKSKSLKTNLCRWHNKPVLALKSWSGWKVKEKAPISVLVLVWVEISIVVYILLIILCALAVSVGSMSVNELINKLSTMISSALIFGFIINVIIIIVLKFIKAIFNK